MSTLHKRWLILALASVSLLVAGRASPEESEGGDTGDGTGDIADDDGSIGSDANETDGGAGNETGTNMTGGSDTIY